MFPVPDGDTGTNLAVTLAAVRAALQQREQHAGRLLEIVADAALDGARGNSGAILAQFLHGACDASQDHRLLTTTHFVAAAERGSEYAREAVAEPREGTMLTVIREFAAGLAAQLAASPRDFAGLLGAGLQRARVALAGTTVQLEALRRAGVVDAGARGFVDLLEGISDFVLSGSLRSPAQSGGKLPAPAVQPEAAFSRDAPATGHRWCTECLVSGAALDHRRLREALAGLGGSLVLAGSKRRVRIHIHVDDPDAVFRVAAGFGAVEARKADDMLAQQSSARAEARKVAIVTDSAADLPEDLLLALEVHVVPVRIHIGEQSYLDKVSLDTRDFYRLMAASPSHPTTSQPPPGDFRRLYQFLASHHPGIVSIHLTAWGSGTFQAAESAADRAGTSIPVLAIDSRNVSLGQGLVVLAAAELAAAGRSVDEIAVVLGDVIAQTRTWALLGSLDHAVRGGRVAPSKRWLARLLRLEPILATFPDGSIGVGGALLGKRDRPRRFARWVARHARGVEGWRLAVGHADAPDAAKQLLAELQARIPGIERSILVEIGTALGVHGGAGSLVVALQPAGAMAVRNAG